MALIRILFLLIFFSCESENVHSDILIPEPTHNSSRIILHHSGRVDTSNIDVRKVINLYENYLNSKPDSIYNNPYWNTDEKTKYKDFDFSRTSMFNGLNSAQLFRIYTPFVLSVEPINTKFQIRVLYSNTATNAPYVGSKVWCIHKLSAVKEGEELKLENLIIEETKNWQNQQVEFIEYVYPDNYKFKGKQAKKAIAFCKTMIGRFNPGFNNPFKFYITNNIDDMGKLENFDFYFSGITTGKAREGMILSAKNDEFYPHELIHKILPENKSRGHVIEEGLATFLGTKEHTENYEELMKQLANDFNKRESYTIENILNNNTKWNGYQVAYPGGAVICEIVFQIKGDKGINQLIRGNTEGYDKIIELASSIINKDEKELMDLITFKIKEFE